MPAMENQSPVSPKRGPLVTYKKRNQRKRTISKQADSNSGSSIEPRQTASLSEKNSLKSPGKRHTNRSFNLPGPSPVSHSANDSGKPRTNKAKHVRAMSSVSSIKSHTRGASCTSLKKSGSGIDNAIKPNSKVKDSEDNDDIISIADSTISTGRVRRKEAERIQYFENQPECGEMEPHQVHCLRCNKPVNLGRKQTYAVRPWEIHRARCDQRPAHMVPATLNGHEDAALVLEPESPVPVPQPTPARRPSEQERREFLESDKQIEKVEKHRVLCRACQAWVELGQTSAYATGSWVKHKVRCSDMPSNRVASAKRRLLLVNDSQAKCFSTKNVGCAFCGFGVELEGEGDYNLTKWDEHKSFCTETAPEKNDSPNSIHIPIQTSRPPSSASTESTLVIDAGRSQLAPNLKRPREDPDVIAEEDMPKVVRPRTISSERPSSVIGWFMMPFHSFVRGFKEGLMDQS